MTHNDILNAIADLVRPLYPEDCEKDPRVYKRYAPRGFKRPAALAHLIKTDIGDCQYGSVMYTSQFIVTVFLDIDERYQSDFTAVYDAAGAVEVNSRRYLRNELTFLGILERFDVQGQYPDGRRRQQVIHHDPYAAVVLTRKIQRRFLKRVLRKNLKFSASSWHFCRSCGKR